MNFFVICIKNHLTVCIPTLNNSTDSITSYIAKYDVGEIYIMANLLCILYVKMHAQSFLNRPIFTSNPITSAHVIQQITYPYSWKY